MQSLSVILLVRKSTSCVRRNLLPLFMQISGNIDILADALLRNSDLRGVGDPNRGQNRISVSLPQYQGGSDGIPFNVQLSYQIFVLPRAHHATTVVGAWMQDGNRWDKVYLFRPQSQVQKVLTCLEPSRVK